MRRPGPITTHSDASGYAMAVLLVALAVMLTLMTMAMPVWRQQAKREREEELLFRLKQYAHALALYQRRMPGAAPANLDDLVKERFLRKKYKDPMTGKDFAILRVGQISPGMTTPLPGTTPTGPGQNNSRTSFGPTSSGPGRQPGNAPGGVGSTTATGPIRAVVSTSKETSLRTWKGRNTYDQWEVAIEDVTPRFFGNQAPQPGQNGRPGSNTRPGQRQGPTSPSGPAQSPGAPGGTPNPYGNTIRR